MIRRKEDKIKTTLNILPNGFLKTYPDVYYKFNLSEADKYENGKPKPTFIILNDNIEFDNFKIRLQIIREDLPDEQKYTMQENVEINQPYVFKDKVYHFRVIKSEEDFNDRLKGQSGNLIVSTKVPEDLINLCLKVFR